MILACHASVMLARHVKVGLVKRKFVRGPSCILLPRERHILRRLLPLVLIVFFFFNVIFTVFVVFLMDGGL